MANFDATSGSYTTRLTVTQTSQDVASNTSVLTYSLTLIKNSGYGLWNNDSCPWSITINGTTISGTFTYDFRNYSSLTLKGNTTISVPHNSDGTKTVACSASVDMDNSSYVSVMKPSGNLTLTTIPRASTVSIPSSYSITNTTGSMTYTVTSKANFYHKIQWALGGVTTEIYIGQINNTSKSFTIANTDMLSKMPTSTSAGLGIAVYTYTDSAYANQIGATTASNAISINTSYIKPSVSLSSITINSTPISGYAVAGYSSLKDTFSTSNSYGASSVTTYFSISAGSLQTTSTTSTSGTIYTNVMPQNTNDYGVTIYAQAKDSRGALSDTVYQSFGVWGYQPPTASLSAYRTTSSTSTNEDGAGTYVYVTFSGAVRSSVNNQNSVQIISCSYWGDISGQATNGGHYALADTQSATFQLSVTDKVASSMARVSIAQASYPLDLYDNGSGTVGIGLGTNAIAGYVTTPLRFQVNNESSAGGVELREDGEGGNITIYSPSGKTFEFDAYDNNSIRVWTRDDNNAYKAATFNRLSGVLSATGGFSGNLNGNATSATSANKVYFNRTTDSPNNALQQNAMVVGEYYNQSTLPTTNGYYHVISLQGPDTNYGTQIALGMTVRGVYYRRYVNGSWTAWEGLL